MARCCNDVQPGELVSSTCALPSPRAARANERFDAWLRREQRRVTPLDLWHGRVPVAHDACQRSLERLGVHGAESKLACNLTGLTSPSGSGHEECVVVSIGSENRWHFEQSIIEQTRCRLETFDCTGVGLGWEVPPELRSRVRLHLACVGAPEWRYKDLPGGGKGRLLPRAGGRLSDCARWSVHGHLHELPRGGGGRVSEKDV